MKKLSFEEWMKLVDKELSAICGLTSSDLADFNYKDAWEDGKSAKSIAKKVYKSEQD